MSKIRTIIEKEWAEVFKNRLVLFSVAFLPLILTALPLITVAATNSMGMEALGSTDTAPDAFFGELCVGLNEMDCTQVYMLTLYVLLFMIMPVMIPVSISAYSIVGEKTTRSLEPLLATPITTGELLAGKMAAAVLPAIGVTWAAFGIYLIGARLMVNDIVFARLLEPMWLLAIFIVGPLLAMMAVSVAVMVSARVNDPRVAEQLSGAVILPIILLIVGQSVGLVLISQELILVIGGVVLVLDLILLYVSHATFSRETILTRWK
ncbi:MAG: ABC transporter permease [Anaerolineales bacterium]|nr:ABC transporter permease [Anaerolineales bacterium]MCA9932211.1 ABC transporter permease [Anaerolineales bacterium]